METRPAPSVARRRPTASVKNGPGPRGRNTRSTEIELEAGRAAVGETGAEADARAVATGGDDRQAEVALGVFGGEAHQLGDVDPQFARGRRADPCASVRRSEAGLFGPALQVVRLPIRSHTPGFERH